MASSEGTFESLTPEEVSLWLCNGSVRRIGVSCTTGLSRFAIVAQIKAEQEDDDPLGGHDRIRTCIDWLRKPALIQLSYVTKLLPSCSVTAGPTPLALPV